MGATTFTSTVTHPIDAKGRVSVPARFREALDAGDPEREPGDLPAVMLSFSPHLKDHLQGYTVRRFEEIGSEIAAIRPATPEANRRKQMALRMHYGFACRLELDRDGRVVLPAPVRARLGEAAGGVTFLGLGDSFELWAASAFEAVDAEMQDFLGGEEGFDPAALASLLGQ